MMSWGGDGPQGENFSVLICTRPIFYTSFKETSFILCKMSFSMSNFLKGLFKRNNLFIIEILQANQISTFSTEQVINWFEFQIEGHPVIDFCENRKQHLVKMICRWGLGVPRFCLGACWAASWGSIIHQSEESYLWCKHTKLLVCFQNCREELNWRKDQRLTVCFIVSQVFQIKWLVQLVTNHL